MPIEFRCPGCGALLRVPDDSAGKMAKCPTCSQVLPIPSTSTAGGIAAPPPPGGNPFAAPTFPTPSDNPYASPMAAPAGYGGPAAPGALYPINPSPLDIGETMRRAWALFKQNGAMCVAATAIYLVVLYAVQFGLSIAFVPFSIWMQDNPVLLVLAQIVINIGSSLFSIWLNLGAFRFFLRIARGGEPVIADMFTGSRGYLPALWATLLYMLVFFGAALVLVGPGIAVGAIMGDETVGLVLALAGGLVMIVLFMYLFLVYGQFMLVIADRECGAMDGFRISREITAGNRVSIFLLFILISLVNVAGMLACCVGLLVSVPYSWSAMAIAYLMMSGQPTAGGQAPAASFQPPA